MLDKNLKRPAIRIVDSQHSLHCRACKERVRELLTAIYGDCHVNHSFPWSALPRDYVNTSIGGLLERIQLELEILRGHRDFIKSVQMPPCDYFVSDPPFILEFDESQHFTRPRLITLSLYPDDLKVGFSPSQWRKLCREINAEDHEPFDRDERRAWYDTLRDLVPLVHGFWPTLRLYAAGRRWCSFDAATDQDRSAFRELIEGYFRAGGR
jgi:hypothetical protein